MGRKKIEGICHCGAPRHAKGLCLRHYRSEYAKANKGRWLPEHKRDPEQARQRKAKYHVENRDRILARAAAWRASNPERAREISAAAVHSRRARKNDQRVTVHEWRAVLEAYGHRCRLCASDERIEQDHIVPLSKGGAHTITNVQPLCRSCNRRKHAKLVVCSAEHS